LPVHVSIATGRPRTELLNTVPETKLLNTVPEVSDDGGMLSEAQAQAFVHEWIEAWNAHDLERILAHWADECVFTSPIVARLMNDASGTVRGKAALRAYWRRGLDANPGLHFVLEHVLVGVDTLVIAYTNHRGQHVAEQLRLGADGLAIEGAAHYTPGV
jgi:hypothetical protein